MGQHDQTAGRATIRSRVEEWGDARKAMGRRIEKDKGGAWKAHHVSPQKVSATISDVHLDFKRCQDITLLFHRTESWAWLTVSLIRSVKKSSHSSARNDDGRKLGSILSFAQETSAKCEARFIDSAPAICNSVPPLNLNHFTLKTFSSK